MIISHFLLNGGKPGQLKKRFSAKSACKISKKVELIVFFKKIVKEFYDMKFLSRANLFLYSIEKTIVSSCIIIIAVILLVSVLCRHLSIVMVGGEEIATFATVWLTFWGMALCARKGNHIIMSAVLDRFPSAGRKKMITGICLISGCFCLLLSGYALQLTLSVFNRGQVTPALRIPLWYMYVSTPLGFFLTGIYYIGGVVKNLTGTDTYFGLEKAD